MNSVDWAIVFASLMFFVILAMYVRKYTKSVADFLAAGRFAGRYMLTISEGMAGLGAISIVAYFEQHYVAGFCPVWWGWLITATYIIMSLLGWVIYRYRQTRVMTMAQFFEVRYSKSFRIYAGFVAYIAGILNFAIFPAVGARFFIYFCDIPSTVSLGGLSLSSFSLILAFLLTISLFFTFIGGQVVVMITDFFQGIFVFTVFTIIVVTCMTYFNWEHISESLLSAPEGASLVNPFDTRSIKDFNMWFYVLAFFIAVYSHKSWQGNQGYNCAAKTPHEARMGAILGSWRVQMIYVLVAILPILAYTFLNHPEFSDQTIVVNDIIKSIESENIQSQVTVPVVLAHILPHGLMGLFCAVMLAAFISTHDTYLHTWGTIFVQDVILPFRKEPFTQKQHMLLLRISIIGVAIFIFLFSLIFKQNQYILLYMSITGAIFAGGGGACIIGGLYWKKGCAAGAWAALIIGPILALGGLMLRTIVDDFPLNEQWIAFITMAVCAFVYVIISLCINTNFNMDRMLHRGKYSTHEKSKENFSKNHSPKLKALGMSNEFSRSDRIIYISTFIWAIGWSVVFLMGTGYSIIFGIEPETWIKIWKAYVYIGLVIGSLLTTWFFIGGIKDMKYMFYKLKTTTRNNLDVGMVVDHHNLDENNTSSV